MVEYLYEYLAAIFSHHAKEVGNDYPYFASGSCFEQCIPCECNEHLCGTKDDCDKYFKTWE